jgi:putative phosphoribosyl transferase
MLKPTIKKHLSKKNGRGGIRRANNDDHDGDDVIVLGIPRGGAIVGDIVARKLSADFDLVIPRKLLAPKNRENAIGAIIGDDNDDIVVYIDNFIVNSLNILQDHIEKEKAEQRKEMERRTSLYRPPHTCREYRIKDRMVVLVDDGIATGATTIAAARWIKKQQPRCLIIAVPVASPQSVDILRKEADMVEVVMTPLTFGSVSQFYDNYDPVTDDQIIDIMRDRNLR